MSTTRHQDPELPDDVTGRELDRDVRSDLGTLSKDGAAAVARHLVMAGRLLDDDPQAAWAHAAAALRRAGRIGVVREAAGLTAYASGRPEVALRELRAARRMTGSEEHLPLIADCERALGRPERALELTTSTAARALDVAGRVEAVMVEAGARLDLGQPDAAVVALQVPQLGAAGAEPWRSRLLSAYADALTAAGRHAEARDWLARAARADRTGRTGAAARLRAAVGGVVPSDVPGDVPGGAAGGVEGDLAAVEVHDLLEDGTSGGGPR